MLRRLLIFLCLVCTTFAAWTHVDPQDPYENYNRHAFKLNQKLDRFIFKPIAKVYTNVLPFRIRQGINNFFINLDSVPTVINDLLQGKIYYAVSDSWRFLINSTVGIGGLVDVGSRIGLPYRPQDFGLTLAKWGYTSSAYFVIPILGPNTIRDTFAWPIHYSIFSVYPYINDIYVRNSLLGTYFINTRAQLLNFDQTIKQASLDPYVFQRNAYLQHRNYRIKQNQSRQTSDDMDEDATDDLT
jgi:phospholipid-binding lipoprotein MlaA